MLPMNHFRNVLLVLASPIILACDDVDQPASPTQPSERSALSLPIDSIFDDPPMLAVARELPSFGGFYFNDEGQIVVALTEVADFERAQTLILPHLERENPPGGSLRS